MTEFLLDGRGERVKGYVHAGICALSALAALYNLAACVAHPRRRVAIGAVGYTALGLLEAVVVRQHWAADRSRYVDRRKAA